MWLSCNLRCPIRHRRQRVWQIKNRFAWPMPQQTKTQTQCRGTKRYGREGGKQCGAPKIKTKFWMRCDAILWLVKKDLRNWFYATLELPAKCLHTQRAAHTHTHTYTHTHTGQSLLLWVTYRLPPAACVSEFGPPRSVDNWFCGWRLRVMHAHTYTHTHSLRLCQHFHVESL